MEPPIEMNQENRTYAALGLAGQMGCVIIIFVIAALFAGIWIDQTFHTRKIAILVCLSVSLPVNLVLVLMLTRRMIARIIPPEPTKMSKAPTGDNSSGEVE
jgi:hypothetical protein